MLHVFLVVLHVYLQFPLTAQAALINTSITPSTILALVHALWASMGSKRQLSVTLA